ncbi:1-phosphofructokinase [Sphaerisporangium album]|uniref:1-phosphofructokinase n=1 Tax=Sphaerisporangium album TaxID=509200 RepID=A0A367FQD7_9ACTN|nr:PfkB family carbohydrate kinase [Sphaerisporangium album]RCG31900.1 1-phosphofructokinase [Sphaerisporangium album]
MILTVTLNLALDVTYEVPALARHTTHRIRATRSRAGGKGVNVTRVLTTLGHQALATGLCGGPTGAMVSRELAGAAVPHDFVPIGGDTRRVVTVTDTDATVFSEPGPAVTPGEWHDFQARFAAHASRARVVVLSGSLPRGLPDDAYAVLVRLAREAGAKVLLDSSGPALRSGSAARPDLVKPNAAELAEAALDPRAVPLVVSRGPAGMLARTPGGCWEAAPPEVLRGNPTGAGDAAAAALAVALRDDVPWPAALADAVALSASAVVTPVAGEVDLATYHRLKQHVTVKEVPCPW